jgi:RHS repeat-associated protein
MSNTYEYGAFGSSLQTGSVANPFTFTGQLYDPTAGLYLFPQRAYDPGLGRFVSEDPVGAVNPYPYVSSNPTNALDPTGAAELVEDTFIPDTVVRHPSVYLQRRYARCIAAVISIAIAELGPLQGTLIEAAHEVAREICSPLAP